MGRTAKTKVHGRPVNSKPSKPLPLRKSTTKSSTSSVPYWWLPFSTLGKYLSWPFSSSKPVPAAITEDGEPATTGRSRYHAAYSYYRKRMNSTGVRTGVRAAARTLRRRYLLSYYSSGSSHVRHLLSRQWMRQAVRWDLLGVGMSKLWGSLNSRPLPVLLRRPVYSLWGLAFRCNMDEVPQPLHSYPTLAAFFARELKEGARPLCEEGMASPVDGRVLSCGEVDGELMEQIKGKTYSLTHFLGTATEKLRKEDNPFAEGSPSSPSSPSSSSPSSSSSSSSSTPSTKLYHCIIYLSPGDYHRIHFPVDCNITTRRHFPGTLFPVNPPFLKIIPWLFALNERVVLMGEWAGRAAQDAARAGVPSDAPNDKGWFFSITAVGAYNVGSISLGCDKEVKTNQLSRDYVCHNLHYFSWGGVGSYAYERDYREEPPTEEAQETDHVDVDEEGVRASKGAEMGQFHFGSTVVLVFEADEFEFNVQAGDYVSMGRCIGQRVRAQ